ncbi:hypothetical protein [Streptomyces rubrolavendulae]|uniref:hypothetical protein n=1 Tax=Streptomyces rubrolavendulae TaxID=285473 RepID=UPI00131C8548|nr:hypothetical protein [Streptomyces rubrolavendulae]
MGAGPPAVLVPALHQSGGGPVTGRLRHSLHRAGIALAGFLPGVCRARPHMPGPQQARRLYTLRRVPPAWSATVSTGRYPATHAPRSTARQPALFGGVLFEEASPVRPYVLPPAEWARMLRGGAR